MTGRHNPSGSNTIANLWSKLSAPLPAEVISWRQDGKAMQRDGKHFARFVAYIEANTVRERLDSVVPGEWDLTLELLPPLAFADAEATCSFKARLQILGVIREDVGTGRDYKAAATDAFKRVGVRFGIAHELYAYEQNWVQVDSDSKYAKPLEDPSAAYARRQARTQRAASNGSASSNGNGGGAQAPAPQHATSGERSSPPAPQAAASAPAQEQGPLGDDEASCPKCGGKMWDNRVSKRNPKAPDFKCRSRSCDGVIWPPKGGDAQVAASTRGESNGHPEYGGFPGLDEPPDDRDDIPF